MHKVMTYAVVVFQDLSSDRDETESERWPMREKAVEQEIIAQGSLPEKQPAVLVTHMGGEHK